MDNNDIRKRFPISSYSDPRAAIALETRPPLPFYGGGNSGLDCLITVLRRIYSHSMLGPNGLATKEWFSSAQSENPILSHAWQMFGIGEEEQEIGRLAKSELIKLLYRLDQRMSGSEPFYDLDRSALMANTFWGQDEMALFSPRFDVRTGEVLPCTKQERGEKSLVKVHHQVGVQTLQGKFDELFGDYTEGDQRIVSAPATPEIIRVEYRPSEDPNDRPPFHSLRLIDLPAWTLRKTEDATYFQTTDRVPYTLIAVVRHRDERTGKDSVRTYSANGANIVAEYEPTEYTPGRWSLEDAQHHTYTLFYGKSHPDMLPLPPLPELGNRQVNYDLWEGVEKALKGQSSAKAQTAGGSSAAGSSRQEPKTAPPQRERPATEDNRQSKGGPEQRASHQGSPKDRHEASSKGKDRETPRKERHEAKRKDSREPSRKESREPKRKHRDEDPGQNGRKTRSRS